MSDIKKTQHFTEKFEEILYNIDFHPAEAVDPFAGNCDLTKYSPETKWELYDIDVQNDKVTYNDSLLNPINYTGKNVITNPPYMQKGKSEEFKEIFKKYPEANDLYKAAILSIIGCEKGILIIPSNFFSDSTSEKVRKKFLSNYKVSYVNLFDYQVFKNTTCNVCSFYFEKGKTDTVEFCNVRTKEKFLMELKEEHSYRIGGEFFAEFENIKPVFSRVKSANDPEATNLFLMALDRKNEPFNISIKPVFVSNPGDRIFVTLSCKEKLSLDKQKELAEKFNNYVNAARKKYNNLIFAVFRDRGRRKIRLEEVYKIMTKLLKS